jgi:hypothetical protein
MLSCLLESQLRKDSRHASAVDCPLASRPIGSIACYIDVWNSGAEEITAVSLALQG